MMGTNFSLHDVSRRVALEIGKCYWLACSDAVQTEGWRGGYKAITPEVVEDAATAAGERFFVGRSTDLAADIAAWVRDIAGGSAVLLSEHDDEPFLIPGTLEPAPGWTAYNLRSRDDDDDDCPNPWPPR